MFGFSSSLRAATAGKAEFTCVASAF